MLRSLAPYDPARPYGMRRSPSPPRVSTGSPHTSPRTSSMSPRHARPPSRSTSLEQQRDNALPTYRQRHAENSVAADTEDEERTPTPSRQVYHSPFASYSWSRYGPSSKDANAPPLLYVEYRQYPLSNAAPGSLSGSFSSLSSTSRKRIGGPTSPYPTSLSTVTASINNARERSTPYPRPVPVRQSSSESVTAVEVPSQERVSPPGDRELQKTFCRLEIRAPSVRARRRPGGSPSWRYSSESESSSGQSPVCQTSSATRQSTADPEADEWTRHAKPLEGGGSSAQYACTWVDPRDDILERPCGYISKKHLVKRHIESKHLQIKPITCEVCGKGFSQRTNYSTHMNTHTGAAPHKCPFEGCNLTFGDPARRHRHMKTVHNHQPSKRKTQSDHGQIVLEMDMSEPEEEDSP